MHYTHLGTWFLVVASLAIAVPARADDPSRASAPAPLPPASARPEPAPERPANETAPTPASSSTVRMTYEASHFDRPPSEGPPRKSPDDAALLHGFRLGYGHVFNYGRPLESMDGMSLKDSARMRTPHHFLIGYEVLYRVVGHSWLNVLLLGNAMVAGIEQGKLLPSLNLLIGAEIKNSFQVGVGASLSPLKGSEAHTILAAGWTPRVGTIYTPVHVYFIPDVDGVHRLGVTTGVTF